MDLVLQLDIIHQLAMGDLGLHTPQFDQSQAFRVGKLLNFSLDHSMVLTWILDDILSREFVAL